MCLIASCWHPYKLCDIQDQLFTLDLGTQYHGTYVTMDGMNTDKTGLIGISGKEESTLTYWERGTMGLRVEK